MIPRLPNKTNLYARFACRLQEQATAGAATTGIQSNNVDTDGPQPVHGGAVWEHSGRCHQIDRRLRLKNPRRSYGHTILH